MKPQALNCVKILSKAKIKYFPKQNAKLDEF